MVTLKEIARQCNVSTTTVSNILNGKPKVSEETKQMVLQVIKETGYRPNPIAQGLRSQKTRTIGIIAEDIAQFSTPEILEGMMACCEEYGYRTIIQNLRLYAKWSDQWYDNYRQIESVLIPALQEMSSIQVDGVIYLAGHSRTICGLREYLDVPLVVSYASADQPSIPSVEIDDEQGSYEMMRYLLSKGHRRIGFIGGRADNNHTRRRLLGYQKALYEEKILYNPAWVRNGNWNRVSGFAEMEALLQEDLTAVFCISDEMCGGVYDCLEQHHLNVGEDFSVAGFDNRVIAEYFRPGLTTMAIDFREIGQRSVQLLMDQLLERETDSETEKTVKIPCRLVERASVRAL
jgi:LacI family transcriptional regulator